GLSIGYRRDGILHVALEDEDERRLRAVQAAPAGLNYPNEWLDAEAARELEPALGPSVLGGLHLPAAASVETPRLRDALVVAARRAGVAFHAESEVVGLQRTDGTLTGVELAAGTTVAGERVVLCTGAASGLHPWLP